MIARRQRYARLQAFKFDPRARSGPQQAVRRLPKFGPSFRRVTAQCSVEGCQKRRNIPLYPLSQSQIDECPPFFAVARLVGRLRIRAVS